MEGGNPLIGRNWNTRAIVGTTTTNIGLIALYIYNHLISKALLYTLRTRYNNKAILSNVLG
jgi:hypothetical protein